MDIVLCASRSDPAGMAIHDEVASIIEGYRLVHDVRLDVIGGSLLDCDPPQADLVIFLSKHRAESGVNAMCVHAIGNFGEARFGGRDGMLVPTHPGVLTMLYSHLLSTTPQTVLGSYEVSLEAVHHGPYTQVPSIFYELGSSRVQWADREAARIMARVLLDVLSMPPRTRTSFFGLGSNHYCAGFDALVDRYDFAGSCARYALPYVTREHLGWIDDHADLIVLDEGSMGSEKRRIRVLLEELAVAFETRKALR